jgi:phosphoribosylamine--glycine ligase
LTGARSRVYRSEIVAEVHVDESLDTMKILVIGGGGREHALVWKLAQSPRVEKIWCAPGNGGIAAEGECRPVDAGDSEALLALAKSLRPDLTVVGPEVPLVHGIGDAFRQGGWPIVGPSRQAAQLEGSKAFSKEFLQRHRIPTAKPYGSVNSVAAAQSALRKVTWPVVLKADGLCAGKGVLLATDSATAMDFAERVIERQELGPGGKRIVLEEALDGEELSFIIVTDGQRYAPLVPTRDYKRLLDGDVGPNTGGMGAYSSDHLVSTDLEKRILADVVGPTMAGLRADGIPYQGFLYFGLMLTNCGPKVLEFNCRLGDPEAQAIAARVDFDLAEVLLDAAEGQLDPTKLRWKPGASVCVVLASRGYPGKFAMGNRISGLTDIDPKTGVKVLHAGTKLLNGLPVTNGGRVLGVTVAKPSLNEAVDAAYQAVAKIHFDGMQYRNEIGRCATRVSAAGE